MYGAFSWKVHGGVDTLFRDLDRGLRLWSWDLGKILIFSNCLTALDALGIALSHLSVKFLKYKVTLSTKAWRASSPTAHKWKRGLRPDASQLQQQ